MWREYIFNLCYDSRSITASLFMWYIAFISIFGGSARADSIQTSLVSTICVGLVFLCLWSLESKKIERDKYLYIILIIIPFYIFFQTSAPRGLLPPLGGWSLFQNPEFDKLFRGYRKVAISPQAAMSALLAFLPVAATLLILSRMEVLKFIGLVRVFCAIALISALIGIAQIYLPNSKFLYFYDVTNIGSAVGIFSNRNHHSVFLACSLQLLFFLLKGYKVEFDLRMQWAIVGVINLFLAVVFVIGSRSGLVLCGIVLLYNVILMYKDSEAARNKGNDYKFGMSLLTYGSTVLFFCFFLFNDRIPALSRLVASDPVSELRAQSLPIILQMAKANMPFGVGFGGFEAAYKAVEPIELMGPSYLNHAHNDWLQFIIEGGVVGGMILLILVGMMARASLRLFRNSCYYSEEIELARSAFVVLVVIALASFVDYPLRTPFFAVFATWCFYVVVRVSEAIGDESRFANLRAIP